ncbi:MAG: serine/threonine protein kinase [Muribaculaceae bacterium]|nr:serine/threonine protein kinase [Muribaculaceae bacterium]
MKLSEGTYLQRGKYRIEKVLGQGSFGITYLATVNLVGEFGYMPTNTKVAIKEFFMRDVNGRVEGTVTCGSKEGIFSNYKRRFIKEAHTLSKLKHPNIIHVLDLFEQNNTAYYVMEYLDGGSLDKLIADKNKLSVTEATLLIRQISDALEYMHQHRMVHLDLKPANIMLNRNGEAILIDFGLTKEFDEYGEPESSTTIGHGTPGYAPIEQVNYQRGQGIPVTMDIYALGGTLYKMLSGNRPPNASEVLNEGVEILNLKAFSNTDINAVISKAMDPFKNKRYQSVKEFMDSLNGTSTPLTDTDFPTNTISVLIIFRNDSLIYYYRGTVYKDVHGGFLKSINKIRSLSETRNVFEKNFTKHEKLTFNEFVEIYGNMEEVKDVLTSFLKENDFFRIISAKANYRLNKIRKVVRENSFVSNLLSSQIEEYDKSSVGRLNSLQYDNTEIGFCSEDGICEMIENIDKKLDEYSYYEKGKRYVIKSSDNLKIALMGGFIKTYLVLDGKNKDSLILDILPFNICFGPEWGTTIPQMLKSGTTIPAHKSNMFDFIGTDRVGIRIGSRVQSIDIIKDFGFAPKYIECTVEVACDLCWIHFTIKDQNTNKTISYNLLDLPMSNSDN